MLNLFNITPEDWESLYSSVKKIMNSSSLLIIPVGLMFRFFVLILMSSKRMS